MLVPSVQMLMLILLPAVIASPSRLQTPDLQRDPGIPEGYKFHDFVEFTNQPNHGLAHLKFHESEGSQQEPLEGWQTLLITPDGKAYTKAISDSLAELARLPNQMLFAPSQESTSKRIGGQAARKLAQASIGVSTSNDLSCNGCGPDNRVQVTDTTSYPFMTMGQLIGQLGTSTQGLECTGTLIGNRHVVTAAHCVFDINASRKMVANLNFAPAKNGNSNPYGSIQWTTARIVTQFSSQPGYTTTAMNYDFALVTLSSDASSGYLGMYLPPSNGETVEVNLTTAGYPGSMPAGTMWSSVCGRTSIDYSSNNEFANVQQCANQACSNIMTETCISSDGQSGSAIWDSDNNIRAVLTGRVTTSDGDAYNVATEISTEVYNQIASWYNEDGDSAGNGTLPLAPSGPGSQPTKQNSFVRFWTDNWGKAYFVAGVVIVGIIVLGLLAILFVTLLRCCCGRSPAEPAKKPAAPPVRRYGAQYPHQVAGTTPGQAHTPTAPSISPSWREGAGYNPHSNQFYVNGQVYGTYVGQSPRSFSPIRGPSPTR